MVSGYRARRHTFPSSVVDCLEKMLHSARAGELTGLAFVCFLDGHGYIADTCGEASIALAETRLMLKSLDAKVARRMLHARK